MRPEVWLLLLACGVAVITDVRNRRIPNWLTLALGAGALGLHLLEGEASVMKAVSAGILVFVLGAIAHSARILGGGDVKLIAAGTLAAGYPDCLLFVLYTLLGGGVLAVAFAFAQGRLRSTLLNLRNIAATRTLLDGATRSARMPYAIAIAFGAVCVALADTILPAVRFPT